VELAIAEGLFFKPECDALAGVVIFPHDTAQDRMLGVMQMSDFSPSCCKVPPRYSLFEEVTAAADENTDVSSFDFAITSSQATDNFRGWFVKYPPDQSIPSPPQGSMEVTLLSSLDPRVLDMDPMLVAALNWAFNHVRAGELTTWIDGSTGTPTAEDMQYAIWNLIDMGDFAEFPGVHNHIVELAIAEGLFFKPECDDLVGVVVFPRDTSLAGMLAEMKMRDFDLSCCQGPNADAWALGDDSVLFSENGWAAYNEFQCTSTCRVRGRHLRAT